MLLLLLEMERRGEATGAARAEDPLLECRMRPGAPRTPAAISSGLEFYLLLETHVWVVHVILAVVVVTGVVVPAPVDSRTSPREMTHPTSTSPLQIAIPE